MNKTLRITEKAFMQQVVELARLLGYIVYHTFDSRRSTAGFPDLTMVKPGRLIFAELKSHRGKLTTAQIGWLETLGKVPNVEAYCWRPDDFDDIIEVLKEAR